MAQSRSTQVQAVAEPEYIQVQMRQEKITPGTVRYAEIGDSERPLTIYVPKASLPTPFPEVVTLTIEFGA